LLKVKGEIPFHGYDGLGDAQDYKDMKGNTKCFKETPAALAIIELANKHKEISILALGPLSNIALSLQLDSNIVDNIKRIVVMGGSYSGRGNTCTGGEWNFAVDPHAADVVLRKLGGKMEILPWELIP